MPLFQTFTNDLAYLPKRKFNAKYVMPLVIGFVVVVMLGQVITQFIPLNQLNKTSGRIISIQPKIVSWSRGRFSNKSTPNYALAITLDNIESFNVQEDDARISLASALKNGDYVTIWYPTTTVSRISFGLVRDVSQVNLGNKVLYSWAQQQKDNWYFIVMLIAIAAFFYWLRGYLWDYVDRSMLR